MTTYTYRLCNDHLESRLADDEVMVLHRQSGEYLGLVGVAERVWRCLSAGPQPIDALVRVVCSEYDVPAERCHRDLETFLDELVSAGLVERRD